MRSTSNGEEMAGSEAIVPIVILALHGYILRHGYRMSAVVYSDTKIHFARFDGNANIMPLMKCSTVDLHSCACVLGIHPYMPDMPV
jgi:hypothetical protein